jgi:hypothetical protein
MYLPWVLRAASISDMEKAAVAGNGGNAPVPVNEPLTQA